MHRSLVKAALLGCLLGVVIAVMPLAPALAQTTAERATIAKELADVQALDRLMAVWRDSLREPGDGLAAMRTQLGATDAETAWRKAVDRAFANPRLVDEFARLQAEGLTQGEARQVIEFRRTPLGRKVTEAEVTSPFPKERLGDQAFIMAEIGRAASRLKKDQVRARVLAEIVKAAGGGGLQAEILMTLSRGFAVGMALAAPPGRARPSTEEIVALVEKDRPKFVALVRQVSVPSLALAYRNLTLAELQAYLARLRSPAGARNVSVVVKAAATVLNEASIEIGRSFARDIALQRS
jgi:hypothetical protein